MQAYLIGTVVQWVGLIAGLVWIACGIYQSTEIKMRKKVLKDIDCAKNVDVILTQVLNDKRLPLEIRKEYIKKAEKVLGA